MDEADFFFLIFLPLLAFFCCLMIFFAAVAGDEPTRLQTVCDKLGGNVVENVCIKNGEIVYKD